MLADWFHGVQAICHSLRVTVAASRLYGRSIKLRRKGQKVEALQIARRGLELLRAPSSHRCDGVASPAAHSTQAMLAVEVEQLAAELSAPGADPADLVHVIGFLQFLPPAAEGTVAILKREWLPYLETRLARLSGRAGPDKS